MTCVLQDQQPGDSLFMSFSGHGSQQTDYDGDELDGCVLLSGLVQKLLVLLVLLLFGGRQ